MPKIKSAIKRVKISERNRLRNKSWRSAVRTVRTQVVDLVQATNVKDSQAALQRAYQVIDKAVAKGVLHRNAAARRKSRLAHQVLRLSAAKKQK